MAGMYPNGKGRLGRRGKWEDFEITRVKLNPEQAVLSKGMCPTILTLFMKCYTMR